MTELRPRRRRHTRRNVLLIFLGLVVIGVVVSGAYIYNLANTFNTSTKTLEHVFPDETTRPTKDPAADGGEAMNILLMGSDTRGSLGELSQGGPTGERSDTMMMVHIPADGDAVYVMSVMRDLWVDIPGHGKAKINSALSYGGIPLVVQTLEGMFDSRIDHVAVIDFEGFKGLTTALGGVQVQNQIAFSAKGYTYPAGTITLQGGEALAYVRERHAFTDGDYQRVRNQQAFVKGIMSKFLDKGTLTNPVKLHDVVSKFSPYLSVDSGFDAGTVASLGLQLRGVRTSDVHLFTLPTNGVGTSADGQSIVLPDQQAIDAIAAALGEDTLGQYLSKHAAQTR